MTSLTIQILSGTVELPAVCWSVSLVVVGGLLRADLPVFGCHRCRERLLWVCRAQHDHPQQESEGQQVQEQHKGITEE